ncbi:hypothetical protein N7462_009513 [Penicillium macrosclerotiorum]|uniref:uncharacterized protein n=1 Tax=Penicillium macrosclerotiorum TaxID=303699 RepID=UPI00254894BA|nr:uncharacterized protein N7462_009513 [Penicillium macrosclerotiorum]KAJ5674074.1 hypothetical protein N7462_009513 [Penicillium macrosclerotiorum]
MLLTLKPPSSDRDINEYTEIYRSNPASRSSTWSETSFGPDSTSMESSNRDLPPPSTLTHRPSAMPTPLPPPPAHWISPEDMQHWLQAKAEEDRRNQEEERTRQESLRLEQRKMEHTILMESLRNGVPPHMVPLVFASMSGGMNSSAWVDRMHQYILDTTRNTSMSTRPQEASPAYYSGSAQATTLPPLSHQLSQMAPVEPPRDTRDIRILHSNVYTSTAQNPPLNTENIPSQLPPRSGGFSFNPVPNTPSSAPSLVQRPLEVPSRSQASTFNSVHYIGVPPPPNPAVRGQQENRSRRTSPVISFHHWTPPSHQQPQVPSNRNQEDSVPSSNMSSQIRASGQASPGRKRKSLSVHRQVPHPSSRLYDAHPKSSVVYSQQSPSTSRAGETESHEHHRKPSDVSNSHESRAPEEDEGDHLRRTTRSRAPTEQPVREYRRRSTGRSIKIEVVPKPIQKAGPNETTSQGQASDADSPPYPSQDLAMGTRSGGAATRGESPKPCE